MELNIRQQEVMEIVQFHEQQSISEIKSQLSRQVSTPQLNRDIAQLVSAGYLEKTGAGRSTAYRTGFRYRLFAPLDVEAYFHLDPDLRKAQQGFSFGLADALESIALFTPSEHRHLESLKKEYRQNVSGLSAVLYQKELERLTIELSWKSSQIEGNTYSLLETERLFKEKIEAGNKTKEEALMLLNHKETLHYLLENKSLTQRLDLRGLEEVHSLLIKDLGVNRNLRSRSVGITGTAYKPLDNEHQIREGVRQMCRLINARDSGFEKALLAIALISYIQPFEDGNKRTSRMIGNAHLIAYDACPLSYRSVDSLDYKKAMLLFYEQNNLSAFKQIFIEQNEFGVKNYFR